MAENANVPSAGDQMAAMRTELAFQRTRIAADRTMMAIMRTSLSMIGFGFTIFSFFRTLRGSDILGSAIPDGAPARFGLALVTLGVLLLVAGIMSERRFHKTLQQQHQLLRDSGLGSGIVPLPQSFVLIWAIALLGIGLAAIFIIMVRI